MEDEEWGPECDEEVLVILFRGGTWSSNLLGSLLLSFLLSFPPPVTVPVPTKKRSKTKGRVVEIVVREIVVHY